MGETARLQPNKTQKYHETLNLNENVIFFASVDEKGFSTGNILNLMDDECLRFFATFDKCDD